MDPFAAVGKIFTGLQNFMTHHQLLSLGLLLLVGYSLAKLSALLRLPEVTGFIIAGILLGDSVLGFIPHHISNEMSLVTEIALGLIALTIGGEFYWVKLKNMGKGVLIITVVQIAAAFACTTLGLLLFKMELPYALLLGSISTATAPATTVAIVQSMNASGKFVDYLYGVVAMDDAGAIIIFGIVFSLVGAFFGADLAVAAESLTQASGVGIIIGKAMLEVLLSMALGAVSGYTIHLLTARKRKQNEIMIIALGAVFITIGMAISFHLSPLLTNMAAGAVIINLGARNHRIFHILQPLTPPVYALFFVLAGTELDMSILTDPRILVPGIVYILFRAMGKYGGVVGGALLAKAPRGITQFLGLCMLPQAGVAIGLTLTIQASPLGNLLAVENPAALNDIINIVLISVLVNEIIGPPISKFALERGLEMEG